MLEVSIREIITCIAGVAVETDVVIGGIAVHKEVIDVVVTVNRFAIGERAAFTDDGTVLIEVAGLVAVGERIDECAPVLIGTSCARYHIRASDAIGEAGLTWLYAAVDAIDRKGATVIDGELFTGECTASFVLTTTAPLDARMPYKAAAAGPFNTVMEAISLALISMPRLEGVASELPLVILVRISCMELSTGMPSNIKSGALLPNRELLPLIFTVEEPPGEPPELLICTPAMRPLRAATMFGFARLDEFFSFYFRYAVAEGFGRPLDAYGGYHYFIEVAVAGLEGYLRIFIGYIDLASRIAYIRYL